MKKFPTTLYVKTEKDGASTYFVADANAALLVEMGEKVTIAKYQLVETSEAQGIASFTKAKRA
jgi:hypothetical protein